MSFIIWRLSHSSDRKKIEEFIDKTHADFRSGTIDCEQFHSLVADIICMANNLGIERTVRHVQTELEKRA